ncbi:MAG: hypothetical protein JST04_12695 [Bdellovibrionales bacterium]|nr:hypothetical protein [Bdellovibrionales bacterium]
MKTEIQSQTESLVKKSTLALLPIAALALVGTASASCPQIEGKYTYSCAVQKDEKSDFATVLEVTGEMLVQQKGCDSYTFVNSKTAVQEDFELLDVTTDDERSEANIRKSNSDVIKFKTIAHARSKNYGVESLTANVTKVTIRKKKYGFSLAGKERSRILGIFGKRHSKFSCRFTDER